MATNVIDPNRRINVYNENPIQVTASTQLNEKGYHWGMAKEYNSPTMQTLNFSEIEYIYANGSAIQNGYLTFKESEQEEIYEALGFKDWKKIIRVKDIEDLLFNPNAENAQEIIDIDTFPKFERVRMILVGLISTQMYDISNRMIQLIEVRYDEWTRGKRKSDIVIKAKDVVPETDNSEELKAQLQENAEKMKKMEEMIAQMMAQQSSSDNMEEPKPKKVGRPSAKKD